MKTFWGVILLKEKTKTSKLSTHRDLSQGCWSRLNKTKWNTEHWSRLSYYKLQRSEEVIWRTPKWENKDNSKRLAQETQAGNSGEQIEIRGLRENNSSELQLTAHCLMMKRKSDPTTSMMITATLFPCHTMITGIHESRWYKRIIIGAEELKWWRKAT